MSHSGSQGPRDPRLTYRDAGVDIERQNQALARIRSTVHSTRTPGVLADIGSFGGMFAPDWSAMESPVLVSSCDGVGTKLKVAFAMGVHDTVGRDLVNHCVNDILVQGARPLFFMDYVATGRLAPEVLAAVVEGIGRGCRESGCALLGGETAEMPGFYADGEYDVAGFIVGAVERSRILDGRRIREGDAVVGIASAGLHTNGYSLARKVMFELAGLTPGTRLDELGGTVGELLLREHRSYLPALSGPLAEGTLRGLAHITGGGLTDNVPRILPPGLSARIHTDRWPIPPLFGFLERAGGIERHEMLRTFNMGIGMVAVVTAEDASELGRHLDACGEQHFRIGEVVAGDGRVIYA
jgi:phosphoribosylformylglycinamidine cyclo-ligase